jgi:hypothetical protein
LGYGYLLRDYCSLVNGVTSIIDEAEFDATWYSFSKNIYNLIYAYCNKAIDANGYKTTRKIPNENLILSVGELCMKLLFGVRKILTPFSTIGGKRKLAES